MTDRDAAWVAEELTTLTSLVDELLAAHPGECLVAGDGMLTGLGVEFSALVASYAAPVRAAFWLRSQARVMGLQVSRNPQLARMVYGGLELT